MSGAYIWRNNFGDLWGALFWVVRNCEVFWGELINLTIGRIKVKYQDRSVVKQIYYK